MSTNLEEYSARTTNWRQTIARNRRRTYIVIFMFFLIYASLGLLVDLYMSASVYPQESIPTLFDALISFHIFPLATFVMLIIAGLSLLVSYLFYDRLMLLGTEYHEITPDTAQNVAERQLYNVVEEMKIASGLRFMPKVFIIDAEYMNAFASGYSERSAMVAITRGLMEKLNRDELQAVMAHELSHIRHLDIKLTLTASLLANLTIMILDMFFYNAIFVNRQGNGESRSRNSLAGVIIFLRYTLPVVTGLLLLYLSRTREYMADAGAVELMRTNEPMASALLKIQNDHEANRDTYTAAYQDTPHENVRREAYLFDPREAGFETLTSVSDLFSTHPSVAARLKALGFKVREK